MTSMVSVPESDSRYSAFGKHRRMSLRRGSENYVRRLEKAVGEHSEFDEIGRLALGISYCNGPVRPIRRFSHFVDPIVNEFGSG